MTKPRLFRETFHICKTCGSTVMSLVYEGTFKPDREYLECMGCGATDTLGNNSICFCGEIQDDELMGCETMDRELFIELLSNRIAGRLLAEGYVVGTEYDDAQRCIEEFLDAEG